MRSSVRVLALLAHPDDAEFLAAGTLAHLADRGAEVHIATMTAGDCGSTILPAPRISRIRRQEAARAAAILHARYHCVEEKDLLVCYDAPTLRKVMELVRTTDPALVFTHSPMDYMVDHETTSRLVQTACFGAMAPNFRTGARRPAKPLRAVPHLYYAQPFGGRDILGDEIRPRIFADISATLERKKAMLACHESQRAFLSAQQKISDLLELVRDSAAETARLSRFSSAEGFRQHLGQGFPHDNLLAQLLGDLVQDSATELR